MKQIHRDILLIDDDVDTLLDRLDAFEPPAVPKWLDDGGT
jgi:hypothetical protein